MTRRPAKSPPPRRRPAARPRGPVPGLRRSLARLAPVAVGLGGLAALIWLVRPEDPAALRARAEAAARAGDWDAALTAWRALNRTAHADGRSLLGEARVLLELGRAAQAERILERACVARPADPE